jgi:hypothetical protein
MADSDTAPALEGLSTSCREGMEHKHGHERLGSSLTQTESYKTQERKKISPRKN